MDTPRFSRRSAIILALLGLVIIGLGYRGQELPRYVQVTTQLSLDRNENEAGYATIRSVLVNQTASISTPYDNVSLTYSYGNGSIPSQAYWRIVILLNQSQSGSISPIIHNILPKGPNISGQYGGFVSIRFAASGKFTLWVIVYGVYKNSTEYLRAFSETVQVFQGSLSFMLFSEPTTWVNCLRRPSLW